MRKAIANFVFHKPTFGVKWLYGWMVLVGALVIVGVALSIILPGSPAPAP